MSVLFRLFYSLLLMFMSPFLLFGLYRTPSDKPKVGKRWKEHFGFTPPLKNQDRPLWIHAVSMGETIAAIPLIKKIKQQKPEQTIVLTTTTATGAKQAQSLGDLVEHRYMPLDFLFAIKGFLNVIRPEKMLIMETELWPNTLHLVAKSGINIHLINARLSERSCQRYAKVQPLFNLMGQQLTQVLCQYPEDAKRFIRLGLDKNKVKVTGSIKFDIEVSQQVLDKGKALRESFGLKRPVWIAASTHQGEDEIILKAHQEVLSKPVSYTHLTLPTIA